MNIEKNAVNTILYWTVLQMLTNVSESTDKLKSVLAAEDRSAYFIPFSRDLQSRMFPDGICRH